jgi:acetoin utilization deacetylase AcuC-like enzyme
MPFGFPEVPERLRRVLDSCAAEGWEIAAAAHHAAVDAAIEAVHDPRYVERLHRAVERGDGLIDSSDNPLSPGTWRAARAAVESALEAADWVAAGTERTAFVAVRPPGHHAERAMAMGFCYFNNIAIAAEHLRRHHGLERVAIFDFDVHHGNGTQHLFEERPDVLFVSMHQFPFYPGTGAAGETGTGAGAGATINIPLPAGTGDEGYREALDRHVLPGLRAFEPDALLLSAGFDAWQGDPLGGMRVSLEEFGHWGEVLADLAGECCAGRALAVLEGGYDLDALGGLAVRFVRGLGGARIAAD